MYLDKQETLKSYKRNDLNNGNTEFLPTLNFLTDKKMIIYF